MRTLRLRTGSLHACSIGKKTRQAGPAQQNNQTFTLGGYVNKRIRLFLWLSSLSSAERKVIDTIKLLQSWVVKKKKERKKEKENETKTDKQTTTTTTTHFGKVFFAIPEKDRLRMKWSCYIAQF